MYETFFELKNDNVDQEQDMNVWGLLDMESTLQNNVILHNKMYVNHILGL
jgi:hypothetical protein